MEKSIYSHSTKRKLFKCLSLSNPFLFDEKKDAKVDRINHDSAAEDDFASFASIVKNLITRSREDPCRIRDIHRNKAFAIDLKFSPSTT